MANNAAFYRAAARQIEVDGWAKLDWQRGGRVCMMTALWNQTDHPERKRLPLAVQYEIEQVMCTNKIYATTRRHGHSIEAGVVRFNDWPVTRKRDVLAALQRLACHSEQAWYAERAARLEKRIAELTGVIDQLTSQIHHAESDTFALQVLAEREEELAVAVNHLEAMTTA